MIDYLVGVGLERLGLIGAVGLLAFAGGVAWHHFITVLKSLKESVDRVGESLDKVTEVVEELRTEFVGVERRVSILETRLEDHA